MKKSLVLIFTLLIWITTTIHAQVEWVNHKADNRIWVKFPNEPKEVVAGTFAANDKDSVSYILTVVDFVVVANIDSTALKPIQDSPEFAVQLKQGIHSGLPNMDLGDFKIGKWKGFSSYTTTGVNADRTTKLYMFMVLIGNKMYSLSAVIPNGVSTKGRDDFFESLRLTN